MPPFLYCHCEPLSLPLRRQGVAISGKQNSKIKRQKDRAKIKIKEIKFLELKVTNGN